MIIYVIGYVQVSNSVTKQPKHGLFENERKPSPANFMRRWLPRLPYQITCAPSESMAKA